MVKARPKLKPRSPAKVSRRVVPRTPVRRRKSSTAPVKKAVKKRKKPMTEKDKNHEGEKHVQPPAAKPAAAAPQPTLTGSLPPEAYMTEQEKEALAPKKKETK